MARLKGRPSEVKQPAGQGWVYLTRRWGHEVSDPTAQEISSAVHEVFVEDDPQLLDGDYAEHPSAWMRYGFDDGPMFVINIGRNRSARFEHWADQDYRVQIGATLELKLADEEDATQLWVLLARGDIDAIRNRPWIRRKR